VRPIHFEQAETVLDPDSSRYGPADAGCTLIEINEDSPKVSNPLTGTTVAPFNHDRILVVPNHGRFRERLIFAATSRQRHKKGNSR
jgi:hypothetical protein